VLLAEGVDVILGHHSHTAQRIECTENGAVAYSLGDLVFDSEGAGILAELEMVRVDGEWRCAEALTHNLEPQNDGSRILVP